MTIKFNFYLMMKINDKHLRSLAIGMGAADKHGYLLKRGEQNKAFQKRWFVLKGNLLFYFEKATDRDPIGVIVLQNCVVQMLESDEAYAFGLDFEGAGSRTYVLAAETQEEMEDWMRMITLANYDFMKLRLKELHQRLDELNAEQTASSPSPSVPIVLEIPLSLPLGGLAQPDLLTFQSDFPKVQRGGCKAESCVNQLASDVHVPKDGRARSFEEMHYDFGKNIQEKVKGVINLPRL